MFKIIGLISLVLCILVALGVLVNLVYILPKRHLDQTCLPLGPLPMQPAVTYEKDIFSEIVPINRNKLQIDQQSPLWRAHMSSIGQKLINQRVKNIVIAHGTFVGTDPLDMIRLVRKVLRMKGSVWNQLMSAIKAGNDRFLQDTGNFTFEYVELLASAFNHAIKVDNFMWTSGNHHIARIRGAVELLEHLISLTIDASSDRLLLIGHSHAGQLFALLTQMMADLERAKIFIALLEDSIYEIDTIVTKLKNLSSFAIDFVTLGTPPRYEWCLSSKHRLLHVINHRGDDTLGGSTSGVFTTRDGDYIQQWGIAGSDSLPAATSDFYKNKLLTPYLGAGLDLALWNKLIKKRERLPKTGHVILTDYKDNSSSVNCLATVFGHGTYTRYEAMLYNMQLIAKHFYS